MKEEIIQIKMYVPEEKSTGTYDVISLGENRYQLANNDPFSEAFIYGTIIEVEPPKSGEEIFTFKKTYKESDFELQVIGLPLQLSKSELLTVGNMISEEGGFWEVLFGGMGYVNLPKDSNLNVIEELNKLIRLKKRT